MTTAFRRFSVRTRLRLCTVVPMCYVGIGIGMLRVARALKPAFSVGPGYAGGAIVISIALVAVIAVWRAWPSAPLLVLVSGVSIVVVIEVLLTWHYRLVQAQWPPPSFVEQYALYEFWFGVLVVAAAAAIFARRTLRSR
jgi:hypothetical protein